MAPDADRMLQRVGRGMDEDSAIATEPTARTLASLQEKVFQHPDVVVVEK